MKSLSIVGSIAALVLNLALVALSCCNGDLKLIAASLSAAFGWLSNLLTLLQLEIAERQLNATDDL